MTSKLIKTAFFNLLVVVLACHSTKNELLTEGKNADVTERPRITFSNGMVYLSKEAYKDCRHSINAIDELNRSEGRILASAYLKDCLLPQANSGSKEHQQRIIDLLQIISPEKMHSISHCAEEFRGKEIFELLLDKANNFECINQGEYRIVAGKYALSMLYSMIKDIDGKSSYDYMEENLVLDDSIDIEVCYGYYKIWKGYYDTLLNAYNHNLVNPVYEF